MPNNSFTCGELLLAELEQKNEYNIIHFYIYIFYRHIASAADLPGENQREYVSFSSNPIETTQFFVESS